MTASRLNGYRLMNRVDGAIVRNSLTIPRRPKDGVGTGVILDIRITVIPYLIISCSYGKLYYETELEAT